MKTVLQIFAPLLILLGGGWGVFLLTDGSETSEIPQRSNKARVFRAVAVFPKEQRFTVESSGFVRPGAVAAISGEVAGKIVATSDQFQVGEFFEKGTEILRVDPTDYETAVTLAKARLAMEERFLKEEEKLFAESVQEVKKSREPILEEVRRKVEAAEAQLKKAETDLNRTVIRAPFNALIGEKRAEIGQFVTPGIVLATLYGIDHGEVRLPIDIDDLPLLDLPGNSSQKPSRSPQMITILFQDEKRLATIVRTENFVDEKTRSLYLIAKIDDPYGWLSKDESGVRESPLRVGQFVRAEIESRMVENVAQIPRASLRGKNEVALVDLKGEVSLRQVDEVYGSSQDLFVRGLEHGNRVIVEAPLDVTAGQRVEISLDSSGAKELSRLNQDP